MLERQMRQTVFAITFSMIGIAPGLAQAPPNDLPPIDVLGHRPPKADACGSESGDQRLNCLNRKMQRQVDHINTPAISAPLGANSPDTRSASSTLPAVQQQYGQKLRKVGHSLPAAAVRLRASAWTSLELGEVKGGFSGRRDSFKGLRWRAESINRSYPSARTTPHSPSDAADFLIAILSLGLR